MMPRKVPRNWDLEYPLGLTWRLEERLTWMARAPDRLGRTSTGQEESTPSLASLVLRTGADPQPLEL
jgi:hypothetical protein